MAYKPYKMKGHALPGINQRASGTSTDQGTDNLPDGRSASSPAQAKTSAKHKWQALKETVKNVSHSSTFGEMYASYKGRKAAKRGKKGAWYTGSKTGADKQKGREEKKSPAKCPLVAALAPLAGKLIGGAMQSKEPKPNN